MKKKNGLFKIIPFYYKGAGSGPLSRIRIRLKVVRIRNTDAWYVVSMYHCRYKYFWMKTSTWTPVLLSSVLVQLLICISLKVFRYI